MKNRINRLLSVMLVVALCLGIGPIFNLDFKTKAESVTGIFQNFEYESDDFVTIKKYNGKESKVSIPNSINGLKVSTIGASAFEGNENLKEIVIPESVGYIEYRAFADCKNLSQVVLPDLYGLGGYAFQNCVSLTSISIPKSLGELSASVSSDGKGSFGFGPFKGCYNIKSVLFEEGIERIPYHILEDCTGLTTVTIPNSVETIQDFAFWNCTNLESVKFEDNSIISTIEWGAFKNCVNLNAIALPDSIKTIGIEAFSNCEKLTSISLPTHLSELASYSFSNTGITSITYPKTIKIADNPISNLLLDWDNQPYLTVSFEQGITTIPKRICYGNKVSIIDLPDSVSEIEEEAFDSCYELSAIYIPESVNKIADNAFDRSFPTIYGVSGSYAETYAKKHELPFVSGKLPNQNPNDNQHKNNSSEKESIAIYSTNPSYMLIKGQEMTLGFQLENNGAGDGIWRKMSYTISDPTVINVKDGQNDSFAYVKAKTAGKTNMTVFDSNLGISKTIEIIVTDPSSARMYPVTMPDNSHFEINGMVIDNYSCKYDSKSKEYTIKLNAYNYNLYSGAIDVFNSSGKYQGSNEIKGKEIPSDFNKLSAYYFLYLPADKQFGLDGNYKGATVTKKTSLNFKVPQGGYFTISNNFLDSPGTFAYNGIDLAFDIMKSTKKVIKAFSGPENEQARDHAKNKLIKKILAEENEELLKEVDKKIQDILKKRVKKDISKQDAINVTQSILRLFADYCSSLDYDLKKEMIDSLTHFVQKDVLGVAVEYIEWFGEQILFPPNTTRAKIKDNLFAVEKAGILASKLVQINQSMDNPALFYYTDAYTQESNNSGIMVKGSNINSNVKVQAFRIYSPNAYTIPDYDDLIRNSVLYNISLVENDKTVQPSGKVQVQIPIPSGLLQDSCKVFREESDGTWTALEAWRVGNHMVFETDHFSVYALSGEIEKLSIKTMPNKLNYNYYDTLDLSGLELLLGNKTITDGYLCSPKQLNAAGECEITVTYGFAETSFTIHIDKNGFVLDEDGVTRYYRNNNVDANLTDIVKDSRTGIWFNVIEGVVTPGPTIAKNSYGWWYIDEDGKVDFTANGIYKNKFGWWKTTDGKVTFKETGVFKNDYGWWRVKDSKVDFKANGIYKNANGWWKTTDGKVTFKENGVFKNDYGWWKVKNSKVDFGYTGVAKNKYGWWRIEKGKVNFKFTGIAKNEYGTWYIKDGKVDFKKNGKVKYNGKTYRVTDGKAKLA